MINLYISDLL
jgi:hypothetical protein